LAIAQPIYQWPVWPNCHANQMQTVKRPFSKNKKTNGVAFVYHFSDWLRKKFSPSRVLSQPRRSSSII
jgi:hypothetical protein